MAGETKCVICDVCNDTHRNPGPTGSLLCVYCPVPCQRCRQGGRGPYCETTPCACACHHGSRHYPVVIVPASPAGLDATATRAVLDDVLAERGRQHARWGQQDLPDGTGVSGHDVLWRELAQRTCREAAAAGLLDYRTILAEEVAEAFAESDPARLRAELVQIAAVCVQWLEAIARRAKADVDAAVRAQLGGGR